MNPYKLKDVFNYLTSNNQLLKKKLKLGTSEIPIPPKRSDVIESKINEFNKFFTILNTCYIGNILVYALEKYANWYTRLGWTQ